MLEKIRDILEITPGLMAKEIAKQLGTAKKVINPLLHEHSESFRQDKYYRWYLIEIDLLEIEFSKGWVDCDSFEKTLKTVGSPLDSAQNSISFVIPKTCQILLEPITRLLALCNQLILIEKLVVIRFSDTNTFGYLNRVGFFDCLHENIAIYPQKPKSSSYRGKNNALVEFGEIDSSDPNTGLPKQLKESFVAHAGEKYASAIFIILSELFGNVTEHSEAVIPGFTALQLYKNCKQPHIQAVISDSGKGIVGTLRPILKEKYSNLADKLDFSIPKSNVLLVLEVFKEGNISQHGKQDDRGLGIKRSGELAAKYKANISVRQETFELKLIYQDGELYEYLYKLNMPRLNGTHICFDFFLD